MRFSLSDAVAPYRGVIFDLDGTLVDLPVDWPGLRAALHRFLTQNSCSTSPVRGVGATLEEIERTLGPACLRAAYEIVERYEGSSLADARASVNNCEVARTCAHRGQRLAIFSANSRSTVDAALALLDLQECFELVVAGDQVRQRKPHPEGLFRILSEWRLDVSEVAYIADGQAEVQTAESAGVALFQV